MISSNRFLRRIMVTATLIILAGLMVAPPAFAFQTYLDEFNTTYSTAGTRLDSCGLCHFNFAGGGARTPYGEDYRLNNYNAANIGTLDSDSDSVSNDLEAAAATLTMPAYSCANYVDALNAPTNLADYVDPNNPGCPGAGEPPIANPNGPYVVLIGSSVTFSSAGSTDPDGTIVSYLWAFGDGGTSTEANPTYTYTLSFQATITATLTVSDNDGNSSSTTFKVFLTDTPNTPPTADAGPAVTGQVGTPVQFNGSASSDPEGDALSYQWDFGDGMAGTGVMPTNSYGQCGLYNVTLTVQDNIGLSGTATTTANIASTGTTAPVANAGGDTAGNYSGSAGSNIAFDGSASADPDCDIVSYAWNFGDGNTGTGATILHSYTTAGSYVVTLTVTDNDGLTASASATVTVVDTGPLDGAALYDTNCAGCHGAGANSTKVGADATRINNAITGNVGNMGFLSTLTAAEVTAIADYLISLAPPPPPPGTPPDGAALYDTNCAGCHGAGANSTKVGADATRINNAITGNVGNMGFLSTLTADEVTAIADYLISLAPPPPPPGTPPDGATLYDTNCAGCHGAGANSTKAGADAIRINNAIIGNVGNMGFLSTLTADEINAIASYLMSVGTPLPPPIEGCMFSPPGDHTDKEDGCYHKSGKDYPYSNSCASCHGSDLTGGTAPSCYTCHGEEWNEDAPPPGSQLPPGHTDSENGFLHKTGKDYPYSNGCTSCHGVDLTGGIGPSCFSCHNKEWREDAPQTSSPTPSDHTDSEDGFLHKSGKDYPYSNGCTSCHGSDLTGDIGPSCFSCHNKEWKESDPNQGYTGSSYWWSRWDSD